MSVVTHTLTRTQLLAQRVMAYQARTGRGDGLDFIRDELMAHGATRFSQIDDEATRMRVTLAICKKLDEAR